MKKQPELREKTRKKIMDAFWEVYKNIRIEKITVSSITKNAHLNRGTFYEYFNDVYDLLDQIENDLLNEIAAWLASKVHKKEKIKFEEFAHELSPFFFENNDKIFILLSERGDPSFQQKLRQKIKGSFADILDLRKDSDELEYLLTFIISSMSGIISYWHETGQKTDSDEILILMQALIANGIHGYSQWNFGDSREKSSEH
ncbi:TetR/AcrR family transcriptional regulator [Blautia liquoris]|uniref:TetR/AcrR family transcriptional regulator n=1 Tax=Blautia liquoris TaxID=2779518 RepID=A0A7M2RJT0_9FIRM|nr:TetR/AcrR family transcriptional regulator [Blautia liquoris]QOV20388.1 TetR/AcrR family transcriptional regulator [Blautia liquoris]